MLLFALSIIASLAIAFGICHFFLSSKTKISTWFIISAVVFCTIFIAPKMYRTYGMDHEFTAKLTRIITPNENVSGSSRVFKLYFKTADDKAFVVENDDSILRWKFNSADYNASEIGKTYKVSAYGMRIGVFSIFPNLLDMEVVPSVK